jgi:hypothetical protein
MEQDPDVLMTLKELAHEQQITENNLSDIEAFLFGIEEPSNELSLKSTLPQSEEPSRKRLRLDDSPSRKLQVLSLFNLCF